MALEAKVAIQALVLAGVALAGYEAAFFHGRTRFFHPAMWTPPAYALLALCLGAWYLASRPSPTAQLAYYYLLWVGLAVGAAGLFFHLRRALRSISSVGKERYRALAAGPPLLLPLAFALFGLFGLAAFHLLR